MSDYATITIEKHALNSVKESIAIGTHILSKKLDLYIQRLRHFEQTYGMDTDTFSQLFEQGELGDDKAFFEWDHLVSAVSVLEKKLHDVQLITYEIRYREEIT